MAPVLPNNRLSVLLAHDSDGWQDTVRRLLEPQGVQTVAVRSGREALEIMRNTQIHVAVLDQQMPQLGGLQVIKLMRDFKSAPPSILLATHLTDHLLHEALGMHVFSVLSKPVDLNLLLDALARVLKKRYASRWPTEPETH
jgi:two-component system sensor histidine kinase RpfC